MAWVTKQNDERTMPEDQRDDRDRRDRDARDDEEDDRDDDDRREERRAAYLASTTAAPVQAEGGFFHIYKKGQGYWTRMGTAAAAGLLIAGTAFFLYENLRVWFPYLQTHRGALLGIILAVAAAMGLLSFWAINKPFNADFLIATDSEMKKVNWTSRRELIGSTKIVILFVIIIALFLFLVDVVFGYLFYWFKVLETPPF